MQTEIACGPISESAVMEEIPFVCCLFADGGAAQVSVMFGVACETDQLWSPLEIPTLTLSDWIQQTIREGIYYPGKSDLYIYDSDRLSVHLCHEADIHLHTQSAAIVQKCATRWLGKRYRLLRNDEIAPSRSRWREIQSVEDAAADL